MQNSHSLKEAFDHLLGNFLENMEPLQGNHDKRVFKCCCHFSSSLSSYFIYPQIFRVALTANVSEHFNNTTAQWAKTRQQHRELRALLFAMSVQVL